MCEVTKFTRNVRNWAVCLSKYISKTFRTNFSLNKVIFPFDFGWYPERSKVYLQPPLMHYRYLEMLRLIIPSVTKS